MKRIVLLLIPLMLAACTPAGPQDIVVDSPLPNASVASPLTVTGKAAGSWYFEGSFFVRLLDDLGNELAVGPATASGDWMTEELVPFTATLEFSTTVTTGTLEFKNDNPSGMPENDKSYSIPVQFAR